MRVKPRGYEKCDENVETLEKVDRVNARWQQAGCAFEDSAAQFLYLMTEPGIHLLMRDFARRFHV